MWEQIELEAHCNKLMFGAERMSLEDLTQKINRSTDSYLKVFLGRASMKEDKIPKGQKPRIDHCIKWAEEPIAEHCPFVLLSVGELKEIYCQKKGRAPKSAWNAGELITNILLPESEGDAPV